MSVQSVTSVEHFTYNFFGTRSSMVRTALLRFIVFLDRRNGNICKKHVDMYLAKGQVTLTYLFLADVAFAPTSKG